MVGLNLEMGRELLWRGFPTDQRGHVLRSVLGRTRVRHAAQPDMRPLHQWGLRAWRCAGTAARAEQFVMLMRSDLLRRYPNAVIYATKALVVNGVRTPSPNPDDEVSPSFRGSLQPDVSFFGFDLSVSAVLGDMAPPPRQAFAPPLQTRAISSSSRSSRPSRDLGSTWDADGNRDAHSRRWHGAARRRR